MNGLTSFSPRPSMAMKYTTTSLGKRACSLSRLRSSLTQLAHHVAPKERTSTFPAKSFELTGRPSRFGSANAGAGVCSGTMKNDESWPGQRQTPRPQRQAARRRARRPIVIPPQREQDSVRQVAALSMCWRESLVLGGKPDLIPPRRALSLAVIQNPLAHADGGGGDLDELVVVDPLDGLLDVQLPRRRELDRHVRSRGPHVREVLLFTRLDDHFPLLDLLSDDLAAEDLLHGLDEKRSAIGEAVQGIRGDVSPLFGHHGALPAVGQRALVRPVLVEEMIEKSRALRQCQKLEAEAEQAARRDRELEPCPISVPAQVLQLSLALPNGGDDG